MMKESGKHLSFHTPGHKRGKWDITELSYSDNLASPKGCIARAEADIARILGAEKSFILTDGSTSGVLSMLYAAKSLGGKKIAVAEDAHESAFSGCALAGITPLVYPQNRVKKIPRPLPFSDFAEKYPQIVEEADGFLLTSPNYYGAVADLKGWREYCSKRGKLLLVDGAHGGHLHFEKELYAGSYADLWVDGVHKSLPALTQGAVVSARKGFSEALQKGVDLFRTTSPSYPIMASVEYAVKFPRNEGLENAVRAYAKVNERILLSDDWTKVCATFGKRAFAAQEDLEKAGIYPEFCDGRVIEFYLSPATKGAEFKKLEKALKTLFEKYPFEEEEERERILTPLVCVENRKTDWVELDGATGRICAANCGLFPPCTPLILAGERVSEEKIALLKRASNVYGVRDGKISVINEEKGR